jgi:general secretion pathway protein D
MRSQRLPIGDLPPIGNRFRSDQNSGTCTGLIILIRPQIIRDSPDAQYSAGQMRGRSCGD